MVRVGIVGVGIVAREHAKALVRLSGRFTLSAAADLNAERVGDYCKAFNIPTAYATADELIADPNIDLVVITTPPVAHEAIAVAALDAGKYVFCEKPLAHSLASAARIAEAEARHPGKLATSYQFRYAPSFRRLMWLVKNGWIGKPKSALLERHSYIPHTDTTGGGWWGDWKVAGGGVLITQLIHEIDLLILLMGKPVSVSAVMDTRFTTIQSEDFLEATIQFEGGGAARCVASVNSGYLGGGFTVQGDAGLATTGGDLVLDNPSRAAQAVSAADQAVPDSKVVKPSLVSQLKRLAGRGAVAPEGPSPYVMLYGEIADAIAAGKPLPIGSAEAMQSLELCMALYQSAILGQEVQLPINPNGKVFGGIAKKDYDARKSVQYRRPRGEADQIAFALPPRPVEGAFSITGVKRLIRKVLDLINLQPETIKAAIRKPGPVHGGPRARRWPWPARRHFDRRERAAAMRVLNREIRRGGAVIYGGPEEQAYCDAFTRFMGGGYADAVNSGTNAIYIALRALDLPPGSEVIVPPTTDAGGTMPVVMNMCIPVPADSDPGSILTSAEQIRKVISDKTSAIVVTHMAGHPVDIDPILDLAAEYGIPVVEDCAQSHGTKYKGRMVGNFGAIAAYSTMFGKQHATGEQGGVVFSRDATLFAKARQLADRGKMQDFRGHQFNVVATLNFNQGEIGMAMGQVQIAKLPANVKHRRHLAALAAEGVKAVDGVSIVGDPAWGESSYYYLMVTLDPAKVGCDSQGFAQGLAAEGIDGVHAGYSVYPTDQRWHQNAAVFGKSGLPWSLRQEQPKAYPLPNAHQANKYMVRVEIHESLKPNDILDLVTAISKVARHNAAAAA